MTTPTAGPDDRSPILSDARLRQIEAGMRSFVSWLRDAENCTLTADSAESMFADLLSALRSARRDVARLDALERAVNEEPLVLHVNETNLRGFRGLALRPGTLVRTLRDALDQLSSPPILEKNDRG